MRLEIGDKVESLLGVHRGKVVSLLEGVEGNNPNVLIKIVSGSIFNRKVQFLDFNINELRKI